MLMDEIVRHAAPTLACMKAGSLFTCADSPSLSRELADVNLRLLPMAVNAVLLRVADGRALVYVYRADLLLPILSNPAVQTLLIPRGYDALSIEGVLAHLRERLRESRSFPHEIGLFLGYPPEDVEGFIRHGGRDCLLSGCWKVYGSADAAQRRFDALRRCQAMYSQLYESGASLEQLAAFSSLECAHHPAARS